MRGATQEHLVFLLDRNRAQAFVPARPQEAPREPSSDDAPQNPRQTERDQIG